jgi:hypothetical protein
MEIVKTKTTDAPIKTYNFWHYIKMVMSVALIFTIGVLWSDYLINLGQKIVSKIPSTFLKEFLTFIFIAGVTLAVIALIVYGFGYKGEEAMDIIQAGI